MQLEFKSVVEELNETLKKEREKLSCKPVLALIWVGDDKQTARFVAVKQRKAQELNCEFVLHHFENATQRQLEALVEGLAENKGIHGVVLQLPLPTQIDIDRLLNLVPSSKDVDGLTQNSPYASPTPTGIIKLLGANNIDLSSKRTVIIGAGRLVGMPLSKIFKENNWPHQLITRDAEKRVAEISDNDILISCTGVENLVSERMVRPEMVVVDGSGVDVDVKTIEPLVSKITPTKGAVGPLTVCYLFQNLLKSAS